MMYGYNWGSSGMPWAGRFSGLGYPGSPLGFWMIGLSVLVTGAIVLIVVGSRKKHIRANEDIEALAIIKRRYAKGELTNEDFQRMKRDLM